MIALLALANAAPHQQAYSGKNHPVSAGPAQYSCPTQFVLDGKKCFQEFAEPITQSCPIGFMNAGSAKEIRCVQKTEKVGQCPAGSVMMGKKCVVTESVPAIPFCPPGFNKSGKGCSQVVQLPIVQKCDVGRLMGKQCMLEDRAELIVETYCPAAYVQTARGCQKTVTYDCTRPRQTKKGGVGSSVGAVTGRPYANRHYGNNYGGGYYANHKQLRMLGAKKHDDDIMFNYGKDTLPPPVIEVISKQCERIEYVKPEVRSFCPPSYSQNGKACSKLITSAPRDVCSNGGSSKDCSTEKLAPLQHQCPKGFSMNGLRCSVNKNVEQTYACPMGFNDSGKGCEQTASSLRNCAPGLIMRGNECIGKRFSEPIVTQQITCVGKGCNEGKH